MKPDMKVTWALRLMVAGGILEVLKLLALAAVR